MVDQTRSPSRDYILGQRRAYATTALILGVASFVNLLGLEKAALAIAFGALALNESPAPRLDGRRGAARAGVTLGFGAIGFAALLVMLAPERAAEWFTSRRSLP